MNTFRKIPLFFVGGYETLGFHHSVLAFISKKVNKKIFFFFPVANCL